MKFRIQPWKHQLDAINRANAPDAENYFGLFFEMGTGKTMTAINIMRAKYFKEARLLRTLIICPTVVIENWFREIMTNSNIKDYDVHIINGTDRREKCAEVEGGAIVICSYETTVREYFKQLMTRWPPELVVVDEAHRLRNRGITTQGIWRIGDNAKYRYILTGSPILNNFKDLWSQIRFLDLGQRFGRTHYNFERQYYYDANAGTTRHWRDMKPLPGSEAKIKDAIKSFVAVVRKSECLSLPPMIKQVVKFKCTAEQMSVYKKLKTDFIATVDGKVAATPLVIVQIMRLQQITAGYLPITEQGKETEIHRFEKNPRLEALEDLLPDIIVDNKVIIWTVWRATYADLEGLCRKLKIKYVMLTGETPVSRRQSIIDAFQMDKDVRVFIGNPGAAGIGINLTAASASIWYTRSYKLEHELQGDARNNRAGSEIHKTLFRWDLVADDTLDVDITERLLAKQDIGDTVLRELIKRG